LYALHERLRVPESKNELSLAVPFLDLNGFDAESSAIMSKPSRSPARSLCDYGQKNKTTLKLCDRLIDDPHSLRRFLSAKQAELYQTRYSLQRATEFPRYFSIALVCFRTFRSEAPAKMEPAKHEELAIL